MSTETRDFFKLFLKFSRYRLQTLEYFRYLVLIFRFYKEVPAMRLILSHMRRCVEDYAMIQPGDKIAVGVSGGKDSLALLYAMAKLREFYPAPFELHAITIHPGPEEMDFSPVAALCAELGVEYHLIQTEIFHIIFDCRKEKNPCSMCAKMRRGAMHKALQELGISKAALGHHFDDAVETFFLPAGDLSGPHGHHPDPSLALLR